MVISREQWTQHGDLLAWIARTYPGLSHEQFEAAYHLLAVPGLTDEQAEPVLDLLRGCVAARRAVADKEEADCDR